MGYTLKKKIKVNEEFKNESEFQTYFGKSMIKKGYVFYKLSDFDTKSLKPCDCIYCTLGGITTWCELKYTKTDKININKLEHQQKTYLEDVNNNGGSALVVIYSLSEKAYIFYNINEFIKKANNVGTVNLFGAKLKDINIKPKKINKFSEDKMVDNIPL